MNCVKNQSIAQIKKIKEKLIKDPNNVKLKTLLKSYQEQLDYIYENEEKYDEKIKKI